MYIEQHNHALSTEPSIYPVHRKLDGEALEQTQALLKANADNKTIMRILEEKGIQAVTKDISNLRAKTLPSSGRNNMAAVVVMLEERGYMVSCLHDATLTMTGLFFCHPRVVQMAKRFGEVVVMDATYNTNNYRMPLMHILGVSNTSMKRGGSLMTFHMAGSWMRYEDEKTAIWVLENMRSKVFGLDFQPSTFVVDKARSVGNAIHQVFPQANILLCTWHIVQNYRKDLSEYFPNNALWKMEAALKAIIYSSDEKSYTEAVRSYFLAAQISSNPHKVWSYLER
jgi:hypothetical protein